MKSNLTKKMRPNFIQLQSVRFLGKTNAFRQFFERKLPPCPPQKKRYYIYIYINSCQMCWFSMSPYSSSKKMVREHAVCKGPRLHARQNQVQWPARMHSLPRPPQVTEDDGRSPCLFMPPSLVQNVSDTKS